MFVTNFTFDRIIIRGKYIKPGSTAQNNFTNCSLETKCGFITIGENDEITNDTHFPTFVYLEDPKGPYLIIMERRPFYQDEHVFLPEEIMPNDHFILYNYTDSDAYGRDGQLIPAWHKCWVDIWGFEWCLLSGKPSFMQVTEDQTAAQLVEGIPDWAKDE